jgi:hypothetical protein
MVDVGGVLLGAAIAMVGGVGLELARNRIERESSKRRFLDFIEGRVEVIKSSCEWYAKTDARGMTRDTFGPLLLRISKQIDANSSLAADFRDVELQSALANTQTAIEWLAGFLSTEKGSNMDPKDLLFFIDSTTEIADHLMSLITDCRQKLPFWLVD